MLGIVKSTLLGSPSGNLIWRVPGSSDVFYSLHAFPAVFTPFGLEALGLGFSR